MSNWNHAVLKGEEAGRTFTHNLGYAILNCGSIENLTYSFAAAINGTHLLETGLSGKPFLARKKKIIRLLEEANLSDAVRDHAIELWNETAQIMERRNLIAHNPINDVKVDNEQGEEEQRFLAVVDMANSTPTNILSLDVTKLKTIVNRAEDLAHQLSDCLSTIRSQLAADSDG